MEVFVPQPLKFWDDGWESPCFALNCFFYIDIVASCGSLSRKYLLDTSTDAHSLPVISSLTELVWSQPIAAHSAECSPHFSRRHSAAESVKSVKHLTEVARIPQLLTDGVKQ